MAKLRILTKKQIEARDEALRHEANTPATLMELYDNTSAMTRPMPLSDEIPYTQDTENAEENPMPDLEPTIEEIACLVKTIKQHIREIGQIQANTELSAQEREAQINRLLTLIKKYRKTVEDWFNLQIANGVKSREFNLLFNKYNKTK